MMKSQYVTVNSLQKIGDVTSAFNWLYQKIKTASGTTIKILESDNGGEYRNAAMNNFCKLKFVEQNFTIPYNSQQNGMEEQMNRTMVKMTS